MNKLTSFKPLLNRLMVKKILLKQKTFRSIQQIVVNMSNEDKGYIQNQISQDINIQFFIKQELPELPEVLQKGKSTN